MQHAKVPLNRAILDYFVELYMVVAPHDSLSSKVKSALMRWRGAIVGKRTKIWRDVWVDDFRNLTLGDDITIGKSVMFICGGEIKIGSCVMIGHGAKVVSSGHRMPNDPGEQMRFSGPESAPIIIENDVWICAGATILPGVKIGCGAIVAAGAVVTRNVEPYSVVGGVPATLIRMRKC
nr:acyltransferase [Desulfogranum japonicum]